MVRKIGTVNVVRKRLYLSLKFNSSDIYLDRWVHIFFYLDEIQISYLICSYRDEIHSRYFYLYLVFNYLFRTLVLITMKTNKNQLWAIYQLRLGWKSFYHTQP